MHASIPETNNFDLLRFCLALTVCLVHAAQLSGRPELAFIPEILSSEIAVQSFFAISGFLIVMSYERSASLHSYFEKRARRILPAYFVVIFSCLVFLFFETNTDQYFFSKDWWFYLFANASFLNFLHPSLPGVFENNPISSVNGALWTLKIEIAFYLLVPLISRLVKRFGALLSIGAIYAASSVYAGLVPGSLQHQLPGALRFFMAGSACYYFLPILSKHRYTLAFVALLICAVHAIWGVGPLAPFFIGVLTILAGSYWYLGDFGKYGDFSYGLYIIHFPIIQLMVSHGYFDRAPIASLVILLIIVISAAILMWKLVESRWLKRKTGHPISSISVLQ